MSEVIPFETPSQLRAKIAQLSAELEQHQLKNGGGGGTSGGMSDDWKKGVEERLGQLHQDVRNLLYALIGAFILLGGAGFTLYKGLTDGQAQLRADVVRLEGNIETMGAEQKVLLNVLIEQTKAKDAPKS